MKLRGSTLAASAVPRRARIRRILRTVRFTAPSEAREEFQDAAKSGSYVFAQERNMSVNMWKSVRWPSCLQFLSAYGSRDRDRSILIKCEDPWDLRSSLISQIDVTSFPIRRYV